MPHSPKFKIDDKVIFKQTICYIVEVQRLENTYYYGVSDKLKGTVFIAMIPESELSRSET